MAKTNSKKKITFFHHTWEAESLIGEGSYGKVYKSFKIKSKNKEYSAIKNIVLRKTKQEIDASLEEGLSKEEIDADIQETMNKCISEIKLMQDLKGSSHIVVIEDYEIIKNKEGLGGEINIRMELLHSLEQYYRGRKLTNKDILKLGLDISYALRDCAKVKVIHRDIKPDNIFVNDFGEYKLGDFGIARNLERTTTGLSQKGTFNYIAPEVYKGNRYNKNVDIYSLGLVLYKYFNYNRLPFYPSYPERIKLEDRENALIKRCNGEDSIIAPVNATEEEAKVILKMIEYDSKNRYTDIDELIHDLEKLLDQDVREIPLPERVENSVDLSTTNVVSKRKFKKVFFIVIPIIIMLFSLFLGFFYYQNNYFYVPNVVGRDSTKAVKLLDKNHFKNEVVYVTVSDTENIGKVIKQSVKNKKVKKGTKITLRVGVSSEKVEVPNVVGMNQKDASSFLEKVGLGISFTEEYSDTVDDGMVISQMIKEGTKVSKGTVIELLVSKGKKEDYEDSKKEENSSNKSSTSKGSSSWSSWIESLPNGVSSDGYDIDSKTQYSYRDKQTTTSTSNTMDGWTLYDSRSTVTGYGENKYVKKMYIDKFKELQNNPNVEIISSQLSEISIGISTCSNNTDSSCVPRQGSSCPSGYTAATSWQFVEYTGQKVGDVVTIYHCTGTVVGMLENAYSVTYREKTAVTTYYFYKWGSWTGYSDNAVSGNDNREVRTRTMYRYKKK